MLLGTFKQSTTVKKSCIAGIIISKMFNNYIAKKRSRDLNKKLEELRGELEWSSKYRQRVQPSLLAHYEQRVKSFMHQVNPTSLQV